MGPPLGHRRGRGHRRWSPGVSEPCRWQTVAGGPRASQLQDGDVRVHNFFPGLLLDPDSLGKGFQRLLHTGINWKSFKHAVSGSHPQTFNPSGVCYGLNLCILTKTHRVEPYLSKGWYLEVRLWEDRWGEGSIFLVFGP